MHLKNEAPRLITIRVKDGSSVKKYQILPGENPAVEVPDELAKTPFVKALLANGSLRRVGADELEGEDDGADELAELVAQAEALGIKVAKSWKEDRIREEIAKKTAQ